ncbi:MAG: hypothetical protein WC455_15175 [Dehalococcoidia bacterium]|jgi:hypothetical protein
MANGLPELNTNYGPDMAKVLTTVAAIKQAETQNALANMKLQDQIQTKNALSSAFGGGDQSGTNAIGSGAYQNAANALLRQGNVEGAKNVAAIGSSFNKSDPEGKLKQIETAQKVIDFGLKGLPYTNLENYPEYRRNLLGMMGAQSHPMLPDPSVFSGHEDPQKDFNDWKGWAQKQALTIKEQIELNTPQLQNVQVGETNQPVAVFKGRGMEGIQAIPGTGGPKWDANKQQMNVELPDGTSVRVGGSRDLAANSGLGKVAQNKVEEDLLKATDVLKNTIRIRDSFDPQFATYGGQAKGVWAAIKDKISAGSLGPEDEQYLNAFKTYRAEAGQVFSQSLKDLSGVAVNPAEYKRAEAFLINPGTGMFDGDSPEETKSKVSRMLDFQRKAVARLNYVRRYGMSIQNIPLDKMDEVIQKRAGQIEKNLMPYYPGEENKAALIEKTRSALAEEFGLTN